MVEVLEGDCLGVLAGMEACGVDTVVTDPPYFLGFMNKGWDLANPKALDCDGSRGHGRKAGESSAIARRNSMAAQVWHQQWAAEALRVAKPGAHLVAFGGTRTYHRLACAIEDAGWEIRDTLMWVYGSGFPKSLNVSKAIDKAAGVEREVVRVPADQCRNPKAIHSGHGVDGGDRPWMREAVERGFHEKAGDVPVTAAAAAWDGWGTALKPGYEPIILARKPLEGTVAANVEKWGVGALNIDGCRIPVAGEAIHAPQSDPQKRAGVVGQDLGISQADVEVFQAAQRASAQRTQEKGRWPANLLHDGSQEVLDLFPQGVSRRSDTPQPVKTSRGHKGGAFGNPSACRPDGHPVHADYVRGGFDDAGSAARFFYCAKASRRERGEGNTHPTVKPVALMRYLVRLVCPPGGLVLDPFAGSGTTGVAAELEGMRCVLIEREGEYCEMARERLAADVPPLLAT